MCETTMKCSNISIDAEVIIFAGSFLQIKDEYVTKKVIQFIDVQLNHNHAIYPAHNPLTKWDVNYLNI